MVCLSNNGPNQAKLQIGALAEVTGLSRDTIRFYERNGLITSVSGNEKANSYRDYPDKLVL